MRNRVSLSLLLVFAALTQAGAQSPMTLAKKMASDYQNAIKNKDFASFEKASTPDFAYIDVKGRKTTKAAALAGMKGFFGPMKIKSVKVRAVSAKKPTSEFVYVQEEWLEGSMSMGKPKPWKFTSHTVDEVHVVKKGDQWLTKLVKNISTQNKVDGKPMPGM